MVVVLPVLAVDPEEEVEAEVGLLRLHMMISTIRLTSTVIDKPEFSSWVYKFQAQDEDSKPSSASTTRQGFFKYDKSVVHEPSFRCMV